MNYFIKRYRFNVCRKLTDEQVRDIRTGELAGIEYARKYKVDSTTIFRVIKKLTYKNVV